MLSQQDHIRQLLPFYITGKLQPDEIRLVDDALAKDPALSQELVTLKRLQQGVRNISLERNISHRSKVFMARYTAPEQSSLLTWLFKKRDHIVFWVGGAVAIPGLALNMLEISIDELGTAISELLRIPQAVQFIQDLMGPAIVESMNALIVLCG